MGIEIINGDSIKVVRQKGYEWAVWQLRSSIRERQIYGNDYATDTQPDRDMEKESP